MQELKELLDIVVHLSGKIWAERQQIFPMWHMVGADGRVAPYAQYERPRIFNLWIMRRASGAHRRFVV